MEFVGGCAYAGCEEEDVACRRIECQFREAAEVFIDALEAHASARILRLGRSRGLLLLLFLTL